MSTSTPPAQQSTAGRRAAEVAAAGGVAAAAAKATPELSTLAGPAAMVAAGIIAGMISFLARVREANRAWLTRELGRHSTVPDDIASTVQAEMQLEQVFAQRSADRLAKALPVALRLPPAEREAKVRQILADEERFARQRSEAMAARAIAAVTRHALRRESPLGAFWQLGLAHKHTEGCKFMAGKFWPWAVLDRVAPPRHYGCTSSLHGFGEAIANGWMSAGDVPDPSAAIRAAAGVVMEQEQADGLLRELELRGRLIEAGVHESALSSIEFEGARW